MIAKSKISSNCWFFLSNWWKIAWQLIWHNFWSSYLIILLISQKFLNCWGKQQKFTKPFSFSEHNDNKYCEKNQRKKVILQKSNSKISRSYALDARRFGKKQQNVKFYFVKYQSLLTSNLKELLLESDLVQPLLFWNQEIPFSDHKSRNFDMWKLQDPEKSDFQRLPLQLFQISSNTINVPSVIKQKLTTNQANNSTFFNLR